MRKSFAVSSIISAVTFLLVASAHADIEPNGSFDEITLNRISTQIAETQREIADLTMKVDLIFSYASNPETTINALAKKLDREQIEVGRLIIAARRGLPASAETFAALQVRYSEISNEIMQVSSKRRLPKWLIGTSKNDIEQLVHRKYESVAHLTRLQSEYAQLASAPHAIKTCAPLFTSIP